MTGKKKKILFFFVHPSKVGLFRFTINELKSRGHDIEVAITSKDVLESLVIKEGWPYTNIFPEGRKMKGVPKIVSSVINTVRTVFRLWKLTRNKKYDLFVTDDLLAFIGKIRKIPTVTFCDDDLTMVKQFSIVLAASTHVLSPKVTDLGRFTKKKIGFDGYKELAYLHPNYFQPDSSVPLTFNKTQKPYFLLRLVSLQAYHDVGMKGLSNNNVQALIDLLKPHGEVYICSERPLPEQFEIYRLNIHPSKIHHALYFSEMFIGDSQTMSSEAAVLGVPGVRCNDFVGKLSVMDEKEEKYELSYNFRPVQFDLMLAKINELLQQKNLREVFQERRAIMLAEKIDLSAYMVMLFENYPEIVNATKSNVVH